MEGQCDKGGQSPCRIRFVETEHEFTQEVDFGNSANEVAVVFQKECRLMYRQNTEQPARETDADTIPCLSIRQPYAWLIVHGIKPVENRTWKTKFRGRVLIHAGLTYSKSDHAYALARWGSLGYPQDRDCMVGAIVGEVVIVDCVQSHPSEFFFGPNGFVLEQPRAFKRQVPLRGKLNFFDVPSAMVRGVEYADIAQYDGIAVWPKSSHF